jgi:hypothetical protein
MYPTIIDVSVIFLCALIELEMKIDIKVYTHTINILPIKSFQ